MCSQHTHQTTCKGTLTARQMKHEMQQESQLKHFHSDRYYASPFHTPTASKNTATKTRLRIWSAQYSKAPVRHAHKQLDSYQQSCR